jgi:hypothetical protein
LGPFAREALLARVANSTVVQSFLHLQPSMSPPARVPPETPKHLRECRPNSSQSASTRIVPRSAGRARDLTPADSTAGDSVKVHSHTSYVRLLKS